MSDAERDYALARDLIGKAETNGAFADDADPHALRDAVKRLHGQLKQIDTERENWKRWCLDREAEAKRLREENAELHDSRDAWRFEAFRQHDRDESAQDAEGGQHQHDRDEDDQ